LKIKLTGHLGSVRTQFFKSLPACMSLMKPVSLPQFCIIHFNGAEAAHSPQLTHLPFNILQAEDLRAQRQTTSGYTRQPT